ncbi:MAG: S8 family serine peptidase, partial [Clostridiales bacterium]|nr:S8 family serine peptidase [Clostridiales bacterium]
MTEYLEKAQSYNVAEPKEEQQPALPETPAERWLDQSYETDRFIIKYKDPSPAPAIESALRSKELVERVMRLEAVVDRPVSSRLSSIAILTTERTLTREELEEELGSEALLEIESIQPDYEMMFYAEVPDAKGLLAEEIARQPRGNAGAILVALLDTGVDTEHPDLQGKLAPGWDFVNNSPEVNSTEWYYDQGHGTSMAGAISSFGATVLPLKVFQGGKAYTSDILAAIAWAEGQGAQIANMSFGSRFYNPALEEAMAASPMLFVCATGNMLVNLDKYPVYPASFDLPNILSVASVDEGDKLARFSNYGTGSVDIAAPGVNITVPWLEGMTIETRGTSVSAAIVSGSAAKALSAYSALDAAGLKERMIQSGDSITGLMDKVACGRRLNQDYAASGKPLPNTTVLDIPDPDPIPDVMLEEEIEEEYEEFGADGLITYRTPMPTAREGLGVVAVGTKLYAIGGQLNTTYYNNVEIYDTTTDTWTTGQDMPYGVSYFSCVAVGTKIYCFGGYDGDFRNYVQVYNTENPSNPWSVLSPSGAAFPALMGTAAVEYGGKIYISGGYNGKFQSSVYEYNIAGNNWFTRTNLLSERAYHNAFIYNNQMYIEGGASSLNGYYVQVEEVYNLSNFSPDTNGISRVYGMNAAVIIKDNRLIIMGGSNYLTKEYTNAITQRNMLFSNISYSRKHVMTSPRASLGAAMVDGIVYMIGGRNDQYVYNTVEALEAGYTYLAGMPQNLLNFTVIELAGYIYIAGGTDALTNQTSRKMYAYNILNKTWQVRADLPGTSSMLISSVYGKLYLFSNDAYARIYEYDPHTNLWTEIAQAINYYSHVQALNGEIYAFSSGSTEVDVFNPLTQEWQQIASLPDISYIIGTAVLGGKIYLSVFENSLLCYDTDKKAWAILSIDYTPYFLAPVYRDMYLLDAYSASNSEDIHNVYRYSPDENIVTYYASFSHEYQYFHQICTVNNKLYIFAGTDSTSGAQAVVEYMPSVSPWAKKTHPSFNNDWLSHKQMADGVIQNHLYLAGGYGFSNSSNTWAYQNTLLEYNIADDSWTKK